MFYNIFACFYSLRIPTVCESLPKPLQRVPVPSPVPPEVRLS